MEKLAARHNCTLAFILTTALSDTIGLDVTERFDEERVPHLKEVLKQRRSK